MNPNDKLSKFKPQASLSDKSLGDLIQLATEKQIFGILSKIGLTEEQKQKLEDVSIGKFVQSLSYPQEANFRESLRSILSIDGLEKSRTVTINNKEYTRTVSEIFATDKDFKNFVEPDDNFKEGFNDIGANNIKYIIGKDILDSDSKKNLKLNGKIIQAIIKEQYAGSCFSFLKDSGLFELNGDKIAKSEFVLYRDNNLKGWPSGLSDSYGCIWIRALYDNGDPIYIEFTENGADWIWSTHEVAMPIITHKNS